MTRTAIAAALALATLLLFVAGCSGDASESKSLVLASTTSVQDSGLLDVLVPAFEAEYPEYDVEVLAVGSGEALELGRTGDADVIFAHSPDDEVEFVEKGFGQARLEVMYTDFIVVGPPNDPAGLQGLPASGSAALDAFAAIRDSRSLFVSRGDSSGTHKREGRLWGTLLGENPPAYPSTDEDWYKSVGQGMGDTLRLASELLGYTLVDRPTYLRMRDSVELETFVEDDPALLNVYSVIVATQGAERVGARLFAEWLSSGGGQELIGDFEIDGARPFTPTGGK